MHKVAYQLLLELTLAVLVLCLEWELAPNLSRAVLNYGRVVGRVHHGTLAPVVVVGPLALLEQPVLKL